LLANLWSRAALIREQARSYRGLCLLEILGGLEPIADGVRSYPWSITARNVDFQASSNPACNRGNPRCSLRIRHSYWIFAASCLEPRSH